MFRRSGLRVLSSAAVLSLLLVGCGSDDDGGGSTQSPTNIAPSDPTASASDSAEEYVPASAEGPAQNVPKPTKPALADEESVEGAQAFLDYLSDARAYAQQTGDTSLAREVTAEQCGSCMEHYDNLDSHYEAGGWASRGYEKFTILSDDLPIDSYGLYAPEASVEAEDLSIWDDNGDLVQVAAGDEGSVDRLLVHLDYRNGAWTYVTTAPWESQ